MAQTISQYTIPYLLINLPEGMDLVEVQLGNPLTS